ncbi:hypothetical protein [Geothermobacter ehrlichii]|uniref:hypothetical protein n=1 Tax=Geothermobacter ehrlichii TaxID=213224 RepID=UPI0011E7F530|nr:hypothetical protein [Geothermobacter ehrlichii]
MTKQEIITVAQDIEYFANDWNENATEASIRRGSPILRRLLVERILGKAWRAVGKEKEPIIVGVNLDLMVGSYDRNNLEIALAGGAAHAGIYAAGYMLTKGTTHLRPPERKNGSIDHIMKYEFPLNQYLESTCAIVAGATINRRELIKYVANVKGGVHLGLGSKAKQSIKARKSHKTSQHRWFVF